MILDICSLSSLSVIFVGIEKKCKYYLHDIPQVRLQSASRKTLRDIRAFLAVAVLREDRKLIVASLVVALISSALNAFIKRNKKGES